MAQVKIKNRLAEHEGIVASAETWRRKMEELEAMLAGKEEELRNVEQKRRLRTVTHVETLAELSRTQAALGESKGKCAALQDSLKTQLQEKEENHWRELKEKEQSVKKKMAEDHERELEKMQQRFDEDVQAKEEAMRQEHLRLKEKFIKQRNERETKYEKDIVKKEEWLRQELWYKEQSFSKQLNDIFQQCMRRAEEMGLKQKELEPQLQENMKRREEEQETRHEEIQTLSEQLSHLQVRCLNLPPFRKLLRIFSEI